MHRALYILDILDIIFAHCETADLAALVRTTSIFFEPAARHLWERMSSPRTLLDAMGGSVINRIDDPRRFDRFAVYTKAVTALQLFLGSTMPSQTCNPYAIYSLIRDFSFPSLRTLTATIEYTSDFPLALRFVDSAKGQCKTLRLGFDKCTPDDVGPNGERFWDEMRNVCSGVTVLELYLNTEARWPSRFSLDGLAHLASLQKLHIRSSALRVDHFTVLARLPELTTLSLIFPVLDDPPNVDAVRPLPDVSSVGRPTFPALTSLEIHGSSFPPALALMSLLPKDSGLVDLRIWHLWTTPSVHAQFITLLQQHAPRLQSLILSLFSPVLPASHSSEHYPLIPFTSLTKLHTLDLTLTSSTPVFSPSLSPAFLAAVGTSLPHLQHLRLVTFDYSYHYLSSAHEPLVTLPSLVPLATGCPNLHTLQLEFSVPEHLPPVFQPDPPPSNPSLQRLLVAWSRLPEARSVHFAVAARWLAMLFPTATLGWGRWSHTENDVPDGAWGGHEAFGDMASTGPAELLEAAIGGPVAGGGQAIEAQLQRDMRGRDGGFAGIDIAREKARVFSDMVRAWQVGVAMMDDDDVEMDVAAMGFGAGKSNGVGV